MEEKDIQKAVKEEVIDIYARILTIIVAKTTPILGEFAVTTVLETALKEAGEKYDFLKKLGFPKGAVSSDILKEQVADLSKDVIRDGFEEFISKFFDVLRVLTGDVLVAKLAPEVEKLKGGKL